MKKVLIIGCCGSGKTVLSRQLGKLSGLPVCNLDHLWWSPGWQQNSREEFDKKLDRVLQSDSWIIDGNFKRTLPHRLKFADTVIYLDYPRRLCMLRVLKRQFSKVETAPGCQDHFDCSFLKRVWDFHKNIRPAVEKDLLETENSNLEILRFKTPAETTAFLKMIGSPE